MSKANKALLNAADDGNLEAAKEALAKGADVNARDKNQMTPLHKAVGNIGKSTEKNSDAFGVVRLLLDHQADVNAQDKWQLTPQHYAVNNGHTEVVQLLLERGADLTAVDDKKRTALLLESAAKTKQPEPPQDSQVARITAGRNADSWEQGL